MGLMGLLCKIASFLFVCGEDARCFLIKGMSMRASQVPTSKNKQRKNPLRFCASAVGFSPAFFSPNDDSIFM